MENKNKNNEKRLLETKHNQLPANQLVMNKNI